MAGNTAPGRRLFHLETAAWTGAGNAAIRKAHVELKDVVASAK